MAKYRTAMGKTVDMTQLAQKNERTRAVGNMSLNARGDTIDSTGKVIKPATSKVSEAYSKTVGNRAAQPVKKPTSGPVTPAKAPAPKPIPKEELTEFEKEIDEGLDEDLEIEKIKAQELNKKNGK